MRIDKNTMIMWFTYVGSIAIIIGMVGIVGGLVSEEYFNTASVKPSDVLFVLLVYTLIFIVLPSLIVFRNTITTNEYDDREEGD